MSIRRSILVAAPAFGLFAVSSAYAIDPVALNIPYDVDIVKEVGGTSNVNLTLDGKTLVTQSYAAANDPNDPKGLPDNGQFSVSGSTLQLAPYNANNALKIAVEQLRVSVSTPVQQYSTLDVYALVADGFFTHVGTLPDGSLGIVTETYKATHGLGISIGYTPLPSGLAGASVPDFTDELPGSYLIDGMDVTGAAGVGFTDLDDAAIFHFTFNVNNPGHGIGGIGFYSNSHSGGFNQQEGSIYILAATLTPVAPEPACGASIALAGLGLLRRRRRPA